jgi:hypothetical protein
MAKQRFITGRELSEREQGEIRRFERIEFERLIVYSRGPSLQTSKFSLYFPGSCIPTNESLLLLALPTLAQTVQYYRES